MFETTLPDGLTMRKEAYYIVRMHCEGIWRLIVTHKAMINRKNNIDKQSNVSGILDLTVVWTPATKFPFLSDRQQIGAVDY